MERALAGFPRYSARLLLSFRLLTPLLTKDDDPFYLFDNPARKDHLLGLPYPVSYTHLDVYKRQRLLRSLRDHERYRFQRHRLHSWPVRLC